MGWQRWRAATERALYGPGGFYHRPEGGPGHHFRTATTASLHFARAIARLAGAVDATLGAPPTFHLVEVGAARGALLTGVRAVVAAEAPALADRLVLAGVELAGRPAYLPDDIAWWREPPRRFTGLLVANEWLDNVPCEVVEQTEDGLRYVEVDERGEERLDGAVSPADAAWLDEWWPGLEPGDRAEVGAPRDTAWARAVGGLERGVAVAIDYAHRRDDRAAGAFPTGTLAGYRGGRLVLPVPDGSCDITAHVALDAAAAAAVAQGSVSETLLTDQRSALRALGVSGARPDVALAGSDPRGYLAELSATGERHELVARGGLGDFGWLVQTVGVPLPGVLRSAAAVAWPAGPATWDDAQAPDPPA